MGANNLIWVQFGTSTFGFSCNGSTGLQGSISGFPKVSLFESVGRVVGITK